MQYTIAEIINNVAKVQFSDGSYSFVELTSDMTEAELDDRVSLIYPPHLKTGGGTPSFLSEGQARTAATIAVDQVVVPDWQQARVTAYGSVESQIEYITENGLSAWQTKVAQIKADNPKPSED